MPTLGTQLAAWEPTINLLNRSSIACGFVFQLLDGHSNACIGKAFGKVVVFNHASKVQILNVNRVESLDYVCREFVDSILAAVGNLLMDFGNRKLCSQSPLRSFLLLCQSALKSGKLLRILVGILGVLDSLIIRERCKTGYSKVNPDGFSGLWEHLVMNLDNKRSKILTSGILLDGYGRWIRRQLTGPLDFHLPNLGKRQRSGCRIERESGFGVFGRLRPTLLLEGRVICPFFKEIHKSRLKVSQSLLKWDTRNIIQPFAVFLLLVFSQLLTGLGIGNSLAILVSSRPQIQTPVVNHAHTTKRLSQRFALLVSWVDAVVVTKFHVSHTRGLTC